MDSIEWVALYTAANMLIMAALAFRVVARRFSKKISLGADGDTELERRIRAHGNAIEYIPGLLIAILVMAIMDAPLWAIHLIGGLCTMGRLAHALGLSRSFLLGRQIGTMLTWTAYYLGAGILVWQAFT